MKRQSKMPQILLLSFKLLFCILTEIFSKQNEDFFVFNGDFLPSKENKNNFFALNRTLKHPKDF
jgi:Mn2+/Fe2+ NRAMP family transporter